MKAAEMARKFPWILPLIIFSILVILGARTHPLWGDEAETALFARNILKYGVPKGWDGTNIMGINNAIVLDKNLLNHTSPWAQYYLVAASFALLGESSFTARLPSILLSMLTLPFVYALALRVCRSRFVATLTVWMMALSVPYILFAYQARYYSLQMLGSVLLAIACLQLPKANARHKLLFVLAGVLLFYANYVSFVAYWAACLVSFGVYFYYADGWQGVKQFVSRFIMLSVVIMAFTLPWYVRMQPAADRGEMARYPLYESLYGLSVYMRYALTPFNQNNAFPVLFIPALLLLYFRKRRTRTDQSALILIFLVVIYLTIMAYVTLVTVVETSFVHVRYNMFVFPFLVIASAFVIDGLWRWKRAAGVVILLLYLTTTVFTLTPFRMYPVEFFREVLSPYPTPDKIVADYLDVHAKDGDAAFVNLDRDHEPLIFHLKDKIRFVNRVSLINTRIFPENRQIIPRYIYDFRDRPDWVILYSKRTPDPNDFLTFDALPLPAGLNLSRDYDEIVLPVFFSDMSRPELELRSFTKIEPTYEDQIFIYRKKAGAL